MQPATLLLLVIIRYLRLLITSVEDVLLGLCVHRVEIEEWIATLGARLVPARGRPSRPGKLLGVLDFVCQPVGLSRRLGSVVAVVEEDAFGDGGQEERHSVVVKARAPLAHRVVHRVENLRRAILGDVFAWLEGRGRMAGRGIADDGQSRQLTKIEHGSANVNDGLTAS